MTNDPTRDEMIAFLVGEYPEADGDEFDVEAAIYWFASDYHGGQSSNLYSALSCSPYNPGPLMSGIEAEGDIAEMLYQMLVDEFTGENDLDWEDHRKQDYVEDCSAE